LAASKPVRGIDMAEGAGKPRQAFHAIGEKETFAALGSSKKGISGDEAQKRLGQFGYNQLAEAKKTPLYVQLIQQFNNPMLMLLGLAAIISAYFSLSSAGFPKDPIEALSVLKDSIGISIAIFISAGFGFIQEYKAAKDIEALRKLTSPTARVLRAGQEKIIFAKDIVPGDVIFLDEGSKVPCDCRITESVELSIDESSLTGESVPAKKDPAGLPKGTPLAERKNMAYFGTAVAAGRGMAVATATGMDTEFGKIALSLAETEDEDTPLQKRMEELGKKIGMYSFAIVIIYFLIGVGQGMPADLMFVSAVTLAVVSIPEGLPTILTITLAIGMQTLASQHALVRKLPAVESLGATTVICTDKTGTLTQNRMTVTEGLFAFTHFVMSPKGTFDAHGSPVTAAKIEIVAKGLEIGALCNNAGLNVLADGRIEQIGDPTESALLVAAHKSGEDIEALKAKNKFIYEFPFDSKRKKMSVVREGGDGGKQVSYVKGAPERMLESSSFILTEKGVAKLTKEHRERLHKEHDRLAAQALRLISVAYKEQKPKSKITIADAEEGLVFVGTLGMIDPPRPEVPPALAQCQQAGIRVVMITGDNLATASAIGRQIGLLTEGYESINSAEIDSMTEDELCRRVGKIAVFARASPAHKFRIVSALGKNGEVVAVTGDGVNDAPAIKKANVGVAMGSGTDVSKEAADMILTDDNFATIVNAVKYGRNLFDNIKSFIRFQFTTNVAAIAMMILAPFLNLGLPLLPLQALWVNIIMDGPPALALGVEKESADVMERKPNDPKKPFITKNLLFAIALSCAIMAAGTLAVFYIFANSDSVFARSHAQTMAFTVFVFFQLFNALNCKSAKVSLVKNLFTNKWLLVALGASAVLHLMIIYNDFLQEIFRTTSLSMAELAICMMVSLTIVAVSETAKRFAPTLTQY